MADFALLESQQLISRKILSDRKIMKFPHCVVLHLSYLCKEAFEACHKRIRAIYERGSRCQDDEALEDIINKMILESDPSLRKPYKRPAENEDPSDHPAVLKLVTIIASELLVMGPNHNLHESRLNVISCFTI